MAIQLISVGTTADDGKGDTLRVAMQKINDNTQELYGLLGQDTAGAKGIDISGSTIATTETNADITLSPNGTGNIVLGAVTVSGTTLSSADSSSLNINENLVVDGDLDVTGTITGTFSASAIGDITAVGSTLITPSNADLTLAPGGTGGVVMPGITINDNTIATSASNANLELNASGTGTIVLENLKIGTSGSTVTTILDEDNMSSNSATALATQQSIKAYVDSQSGTGGISFSGNTITSDSNADIEILPGGTGVVILNAIGSNDSSVINVRDGLDVDGTLSLNSGTTVNQILDEDDMSSNSATALATQQSIKAYVDSEVTSGGTLTVIDDSSSAVSVVIANDDLKIAGGNNITTSASGDSISVALDGALTGLTSVQVDSINIQDNSITTDSNADLTLSPGGTGAVVMPGITINDNTITTSASNANLELSAAGTGSVSIDGIQIKGTEISSADSTQVTIKENLHVTGNISGTITGTVSTLDADNTTVSNIEVDNFKAATIVTEAEGIGSNDNDTTLPTSAAVKDYVDNNAGGSTGDITFTGSTIISPSNADITLDPSGTGGVVAQGPVTFNAGYIEKINTLTSASTITVNCALASIHTVTLGTSTEFNITNLPTGGSVTLIITQDGSGNRTATFGTDSSTAVKFPSNSSTLSTGAADIDVVTIVNDGTNFLGNIAKDYRSS